MNLGKKSVDDPEFVALANHLAGAAEMASAVLGKKDDPEVQEVGRVLGAISSHFFTRTGKLKETSDRIKVN